MMVAVAVSVEGTRSWLSYGRVRAVYAEESVGNVPCS